MYLKIKFTCPSRTVHNLFPGIFPGRYQRKVGKVINFLIASKIRINYTFFDKKIRFWLSFFERTRGSIVAYTRAGDLYTTNKI